LAVRPRGPRSVESYRTVRELARDEVECACPPAIFIGNKLVKESASEQNFRGRNA
jgi:hypothetical protein